MIRTALVVTTLVVALILSVASGKEDKEVEKEVSKASAVATLSAADLHSEYQANEVAADEKYKGKVVVITGTVDSIGKDIADTPYVTLSAGQFEHVQCMFSKDRAGELAKVSKGQQARLKGKVQGKMMFVILRGCMFD